MNSDFWPCKFLYMKHLKFKLILLFLQGRTFHVFKYIQEVFHVYFNKFEIAVTHLFLVIFCKS